jgi:hypothetical protein
MNSYLFQSTNIDLGLKHWLIAFAVAEIFLGQPAHTVNCDATKQELAEKNLWALSARWKK